MFLRFHVDVSRSNDLPLIDETNVLLKMVFVVTDVVHRFEQGLILSKVDCGVDYSLLRTVLSKISLNQKGITL